MKKHIVFPDQRTGERLILLVRRHWTRLLRHVLKFVIAAIVPIIIYIVVIIFVDFTLDPDALMYMIITMGVSLYYLFIWLFFLNDFIDYHLDIWIVTDQRIINIEQEGLFNRVISSQSIERVQDVTSEVKGKVATFLDYGNVHVQTAGEEKRFEFEEVPHPSKITRIIQDIHDRVEEREEQEDREALAKTLKQHGVSHVTVPPKNLSAEPAIAPPRKPHQKISLPPKVDKQHEDRIF